MESTRNKLVRIKIEAIILSEENLKENDIHLFEKLKKTLSKRGQIKNIVVCETENGFECLEGSKIVKAMKELGEKSIIAFNLGELSDSEKNIVKIELFRDYFVTNYVMVGKLIKQSLNDLSISEICNTIPFDTRQAQHLVNMHDFDWEDFNQTKLEGQSSLFDVFENKEVTETVEKDQHIKPEGTFDDKFYIMKGKEVISESSEISIDKEFDERYLESYEKAINEPILENQNENFTFPTDLDILSDEPQKPVEDSFLKELNSQKINIHKEPKKENVLETDTHGCVVVGDSVILETPKKGKFSANIKKISEKWVYYIDEESGKESSLETAKFLSSFKSKKNENSKQETLDNKKVVEQKLEQPTEQENVKQPIVKLEQTYKLERNEGDVTIGTEMSVKQEIKQIEKQPTIEKVEEKKTEEVEESKPIFLTETKIEVIKELEKRCLEFAKTKQKDASSCNVDYSVSPNGEIKITCVYYSTRFNKYSLPLKDVSKIIWNEMDLSLFQQEKLETESFYYDHLRRVVIVTKNSEQIIPNIKFIAQQILKAKTTDEIEEEQITYSAKELDNGAIEIFSITYVSKYGVTMRIMLIEFAEFLMKIDFEN
ncbi:MAG: Cellulophaga phage phiSM [Bacteroidota bacterium]|jgi:hypothetical protein